VATYGGPDISTDDLALHLDAGSTKSHAGLGPELVTASEVTAIGDGNYVTISNGGTTVFSTGATLVANKTYQVSRRSLARRGTTSATFRITLSGWSGSPNINGTPGTTITSVTKPPSSGPLNVCTDNTGVDFDLEYLSVREIDTTWYDLSGNGNHGTNIGMVYDIDRSPNFYFNGSNVSNIPNSPSLNPTTGLTIESWVKFDTNSADFIFEKGNVNTQYSLFSHGTDIMFRTFHAADSGYHNTSQAKTTIGVVNGQWHHIVGSWDGAVKRIFIDGLLKYSLNKSGALITRTTDAAVGRFGGTTSGYHFNGKIAKVAVYGRGLTADEIWRHFTALRGRFGV